KGDIIGEEYIYNLLDWKTSLYLDMNLVDSASIYIGKIEAIPNFAQNQQILINKYKAQLEYIRGNPGKAYELSEKALEESLKVQAELAEEMDNLLYAQTEAEHHRLAFEKSEIEKKERNIWIIAISLLLIFISIIGIILLRRKDQKLKKTLKELNETANVQIALMQQLEVEVRKEEQERISQNLHDELAGMLAAIKNNIDLHLTEIKEDEQLKKLLNLSEMISQAFNSVRNKSHELFETSQLPTEEIFCQYIMHLAHIAFPDKHYNLTIEIDDYCLVN